MRLLAGSRDGPLLAEVHAWGEVFRAVQRPPERSRLAEAETQTIGVTAVATGKCCVV